MELPPMVQQCSGAQQDVVLSVSGRPEQIDAFQADAFRGYPGWKVASRTGRKETTDLVLRTRAEVPYYAVTAAELNGRLRSMVTRVTFECPRD